MAAQDDALLTTKAPPLSCEEASRFASSRFGVGGVAKALTSERDQNFHLRAVDGAQYVLKVANPAEDAAVLDFQNRALEHMALVDPDLPVPRLVRAIDGAATCVLQAPDAPPRIVRLLTWLSGLMLHQVPRTPRLRADLGALHARVGLALRDFSHPAADHHLSWDLKHTLELERLLPHVADPGRRALAERALERFARRAQPALARLRTQVIHNDLNFHNVVVAEDDPERIAGVLDFGDMVRSPLACDAAVAAAYHVRPDATPLADAGEYLAAYHAVSPFEDAELEVLADLILGRLVMTVLITGWRATEHPENRDYILRNNPVAWAGLAALEAMGPGEAADTLRRACRAGGAR